MKTIIKTKAVADFYLDTRSKLKNGKHSLKIRITYLRKSNYIAIKGYEFSPEEWNKTLTAARTPQQKQLKLTLSDILVKVNNLIDKMDEFNFEALKRQVIETKEQKIERTTLTFLFQEYISILEKQDRYKSAEVYQHALHSFIAKFGNIDLSKINADILYDYEKWMVSRGNSLTTIGIYMRNLRCIFNSAIRDGIIDSTKYPFGKGLYTIPKGENKKKALHSDEIKKLLNFRSDNIYEQRAIDFWCFSYLTNGINFKDIFNLKKKDLSGSKLTFIRQKTKRTTKGNTKPIEVVYAPEVFTRICEIINRWGNTSSDGNSYLFNLLEEGLNEKERDRKSVV